MGPAHLHGAAACPSDTCGGTIPRRMCWRRPGGRSSVSLGPQSAGAALRCFAGRVCLLTCNNPFFLRLRFAEPGCPFPRFFSVIFKRKKKHRNSLFTDQCSSNAILCLPPGGFAKRFLRPERV